MKNIVISVVAVAFIASVGGVVNAANIVKLLRGAI